MASVLKTTTTAKDKVVSGNTYSNGNPALDVYTNHGATPSATATTTATKLPANNSTTVKATTPKADTNTPTLNQNNKANTGLPTSGSGNTGSGSGSGSAASSSAIGSPSWTNNQLQQIYQNIGKNDYVPGEFSNPELQQIVNESTVKSDDYYTQRATNQYTPQYNTDVQSVNQAERAQNLAYNRQEQQTTSAYQKSLDTANANKVSTMANVRNSAIRRGMGRSSYALQTEGETEAALNKSINDLSTEYMNDINYIGELRANLTKDTQEKLATLASNLEISIREGAEALKDKDIDRRNAALNNLGNARANWDNMVEQIKADNANNNRSTTLSVLSMIADNYDRGRASSSGGGGGGGGNLTPAAQPIDYTQIKDTSNQNQAYDFNTWYNNLSSATSTSSKSAIQAKKNQINYENEGNLYTAAHQYAENRMNTFGK